MNADEKRALIEKFIRAYNSFDIEGMMALVHSEIEFKNVSAGAVTTSASGAEHFRWPYSREAYSQRENRRSSGSHPRRLFGR